jgi:hypothetical protein
MVLTDLINVNRAHFVETNDFKEPKFSVAIMNCERVIHTTYNHLLAPGALHHDALSAIVK